MQALITKKLGMSSIINDDGLVLAVTELFVDNNQVLGYKTEDKDGYNSIVLGSGLKKNLAKSIKNQFKKAINNPKIIKEFRLPTLPENQENVGQPLTADVFSIGDLVDAIGTSKGKGWAGTIKRHNFHRGRKTHGGRSYRRVGSIGSMYPQHILKGKKMAGRMGHQRVTIKNLKIVNVDLTRSIIQVSGAIPGPRKSTVYLATAKSTRPKQQKVSQN